MIRVGQRLGKYKLKRRIARGGSADVFEAYDTIEGVSVALKVPHGDKANPDVRTDFDREVKVSAKLDHPNILTLKNADVIDGHLTVAYPMGEGSLDERLSYRMSTRKVLDYAEQLLEALAHAHEHRVIHCDVKPDNLILFAEGGLRLGDFGLAKSSVRTLQASSSGTLGYMAPEQAMGRPSARSDVFSAGLIIYRMLSGKLPDWPYKWPMPGLDRLRSKAPDMIAFLQRALQLEARRRFRDGHHMLSAFLEAKKRTWRRLDRTKRSRR